MEFLANDFFLIAHDEQSGKLRLQKRVAGIGLAGALLGELVLNGNIHAARGSLSVLRTAPTGDDLADRVLYQLASEPEHQSVRTWLLFLAQGGDDRVGTRLARAGLVTPTKARRPWGTAVRYIPADLNRSGRPAVRLNTRINSGDPLTVADSMLAGLVAVTGLTKHVWWESNAFTSHHLQTATASLPISLHELLAHTEAAVGDVVLGTNL